MQGDALAFRLAQPPQALIARKNQWAHGIRRRGASASAITVRGTSRSSLEELRS